MRHITRLGLSLPLLSVFLWLFSRVRWPLLAIRSMGNAGSKKVRSMADQDPEPETKMPNLQRLWDKAYDDFRTRNSQLSIEYEKILAFRLQDGSAAKQFVIEQANPDIRHGQMVQVIESNLDRIQRLVDEKKIPDSHVRSIIALKQEIHQNLQSFRPAALPLAALSFVLDILMTDPVTEPFESLFNSMVSLLRRIQLHCRFPEIFDQLDGPVADEYSPRLRRRIEEVILSIYTISLDIEIKCVLSQFRETVSNPEVRDSVGFQWDDLVRAGEELRTGTLNFMPASLGLLGARVIEACILLHQSLTSLELSMRGISLIWSWKRRRAIQIVSDYRKWISMALPVSGDSWLPVLVFSNPKDLRPPMVPVVSACVELLAGLMGLRGTFPGSNHLSSCSATHLEAVNLDTERLERAVRAYFSNFAQNRLLPAYSIPIMRKTTATFPIVHNRGSPNQTFREEFVNLVLIDTDDGLVGADGSGLWQYIPLSPFWLDQESALFEGKHVVKHPVVPEKLEFDKSTLRTGNKAKMLALPSDLFYQYTPLALPISTRVLVFEPSDDATLSFRIEELDLANNPPVLQYHAVSYTWDEQKPIIQVFCDGKIMFVTKNCVGILRTFQAMFEHIDREHPGRNFILPRLWIDQICINQKCSEEKQHQVALMAKIYSLADTVIVYPGPCDIATQKLVASLGTADEGVEFLGIGNLKNFEGNLIDRTESPLGEKTIEKAIPWSKQLIEFVCRDDSEEGPLEASQDAITKLLETFLQRGWFHRMWTIQEVAMSPSLRTMLLLCDGRQIRGCSFLAFSRNVWRLGSEFHSLPYQTPMFVQSLQEIFLLRDQDGEATEKDLDLAAILLDTRQKKCSDARDKVFALYGMVERFYPDFPRPDYSKATADVYTEACTFCLENAIERHRNTRNSGSLMLLYAAPRSAYGSRLAGLPSWVPDLSQFPTFNGELSSRSGQRNHFHHIHTGDETHQAGFAASGDSLPRFRVFSDQKKLRLSGKIVQRIVRVGWAAPAGDDDIESSLLGQHLGRAAAHVLLHWALTMHETGLPWLGVLGRLFRLAQEWGKLHRSYQPPVIDLGGVDLWEVWSRLSPINSKPILVDLLKEGITFGFSDFPLSFPTFPLPSEHSLTMDDAAKIGLVFGAVEPGDSVALISGMDVPIVLRATDTDDYVLVGYGWFDGIMSGEYWPEEGDLVEIDIV